MGTSSTPMECGMAQSCADLEQVCIAAVHAWQGLVDFRLKGFVALFSSSDVCTLSIPQCSLASALEVAIPRGFCVGDLLFLDVVQALRIW